MTREKFFEMFDTVAATKASVIVNCIRNARTIKDAEWHAHQGAGELQGLYRGYTDAGEVFNVCDRLDEEFFKRMWYYITTIDEELARFMVNHKRKKK